MQVTSAIHGVKAPAFVPAYAHQFDVMTEVCQHSLAAALKRFHGVMFRVDTGDLFARFLAALPEQDRQYHTCHTCRSFIEHFGALISIDENGAAESVLWQRDAVPEPYRAAVAAMEDAVLKAPIISPFVWDAPAWGVREAGGFTHLWALPDAAYRHARRDLSASQVMAARCEDYRNLQRAMHEMPAALVERAHAMLTAGDLARGEKLIPQAAFLRDLQQMATREKNNTVRTRLIWRAVATAPAGWCSPRASAFGALVSDIEAGYPIDLIKSRHDDRMDPLQYQRPSAPASVGNIQQAEKLFATLGLAPALNRRFARADEIDFIWMPTPEQAKTEGGVFGHLLSKSPKGAAQLMTSAQQITFVKFRRDILPIAKAIDLMVPGRGNFCAFTTQEEPDAPPILQWDSAEHRNPFAWYVYSGGSMPFQWNLQGGAMVRVTKLSLMPPLWRDENAFGHFGKRVLLVLENCRDGRCDSLAIFPECLRSELHGVRATIEAHSRAGRLAPLTDQNAAGLIVDDHSTATVIVHTAAGIAYYTIDRWE